MHSSATANLIWSLSERRQSWFRASMTRVRKFQSQRLTSRIACSQCVCTTTKRVREEKVCYWQPNKIQSQRSNFSCWDRSRWGNAKRKRSSGSSSYGTLKALWAMLSRNFKEDSFLWSIWKTSTTPMGQVSSLELSTLLLSLTRQVFFSNTNTSRLVRVKMPKWCLSIQWLRIHVPNAWRRIANKCLPALNAQNVGIKLVSNQIGMVSVRSCGGAQIVSGAPAVGLWSDKCLFAGAATLLSIQIAWNLKLSKLLIQGSLSSKNQKSLSMTRFNNWKMLSTNASNASSV